MREIVDGFRAYDCRFQTARGERSWVRYYDQRLPIAAVEGNMRTVLEREFPGGAAELVSVEPLCIVDVAELAAESRRA